MADKPDKIVEEMKRLNKLGCAEGYGEPCDERKPCISCLSRHALKLLGEKDREIERQQFSLKRIAAMRNTSFMLGHATNEAERGLGTRDG